MFKKSTIYAVSTLLLFLSFSLVNGQGWKVYDASVLPSATTGGGDTLDISNVADNSPGAGMVLEVIDDADISGNKILKYLNPDGKTMFRHYFDDTYTDSNFTFIVRVKGEMDAQYDRVFDLNLRNGNAGTRDEVRIWAQDSTLELEKAGVSTVVDKSFYEWHTIRVKVSGDEATIYIDENPIPVLTGISTSASTDKYLKIGDGSGDAIGGYLDWCILDMSGAYAPGEGDPIPDGLHVDKDVLPAEPKWLVYDGSVLPSATDGGGDTLDLTSVSDNSPGAGFVQEVIDDPDIDGNKLLKYLHPDGKTMYRHYFDDAYTGTAFTMLARVRGEMDAAYDRIFDFQWRNGNSGTRDELRIWAADSLMKLDKAGVSVNLDRDFYKWNTLRITVDGDSASVYINENPDPVLTGLTADASTDKYLKIGDGSGDAIGGYLDWFIVDFSGAYAPGDGLPLPEGLKVDADPKPMEPKWLVYDGSILPSVTNGGGDTLDLTSVSDDSPGAGFIQEVIDDPDIEGNKLLKYLHPDGKTMYRHYFDDEYMGKDFTLMARVRGEMDETYDRIFDFQWRNGNSGTRDELRIWGADSLIELEKANVSENVDRDFYKWHTIRIAVHGDSAVVYINEQAEPVISGLSESATTDKYLKIGDGSGDAIGGYLDWFIVDYSGAYAPGEGLAVPGDLYVDKDFPPVEPKWLVYDASILPYETGPGGDTLYFKDFSQDAPGADFVENIIDDPEIEGNKILEYLQPNGTRMYRYFFDDNYTGQALTLIARVKGDTSSIYDRVFDLQWRNANVGTREELRIWGHKDQIELEKADIKADFAYDLFKWHTIRIAVDGSKSTVFVDENPEPLVSGVTAESTSDMYIKIGDGSGDAIGGYLDWCILDVSGAYAPGEGLPFPEGLKVDDYTVSAESEISAIPQQYKLSQNYPNPFNPTTKIQYAIPKEGFVKLSIYNILGELVTTLVNTVQKPGYYEVNFNAANLSSGIYFYNIQSGNFIQTNKMILLK